MQLSLEIKCFVMDMHVVVAIGNPSTNVVGWVDHEQVWSKGVDHIL